MLPRKWILIKSKSKRICKLILFKWKQQMLVPLSTLRVNSFPKPWAAPVIKKLPSILDLSVRFCLTYAFNQRNFFLFAKDCLLTGQEQACTRVTRLFGWLFGCHHAKNGPIHRKMADDRPLVITSKVKPFSRPGKRNEWFSQSFA